MHFQKKWKFRRVGGVHDYGILRAWGGGVTHPGISERKGGLKHGSRPWLGMDIFWNCPITACVLTKRYNKYIYFLVLYNAVFISPYVANLEAVKCAWQVYQSSLTLKTCMCCAWLFSYLKLTENCVEIISIDCCSSRYSAVILGLSLARRKSVENLPIVSKYPCQLRN